MSFTSADADSAARPSTWPTKLWNGADRTTWTSGAPVSDERSWAHFAR